MLTRRPLLAKASQRKPRLVSLGFSAVLLYLMAPDDFVARD